MDTLLHHQELRLVQAIDGPVHHWLKAHRAFQQILEQGFAEMPIDPTYLHFHAPRIYTGLAHIVSSAAHARFEIQHARLDELGEDMESGLMRRRDDERKNQIHWFPGVSEIWRSQGAPQEQLFDMHASCSELDSAAFMISCSLAGSFDAQNMIESNAYPGSLTMRFAHSNRLTRLLDYMEHSSRAEAPDAKIHIDRGGFTVHWESTHPGLALWNKHKETIRTNETRRNTVLIFPSRKVGIVAGRHWFQSPGTVHGVRDETRSERTGDNRRAIVSFVHCVLTPEDVAYYHANQTYFKPRPQDYPL